MGNSKGDRSFFFDFPKFFEEIFSKDFSQWNKEAFNNFGIYIPATNVKETPSAYFLEMTAPGRQKSDFNIQFSLGKLTISVPKQPLEKLEDGEHYKRKEFAYPAFKRQFHFPKHVVEKQRISATYIDGILRVRLPKKEKTAHGESGFRINVD